MFAHVFHPAAAFSLRPSRHTRQDRFGCVRMSIKVGMDSTWPVSGRSVLHTNGKATMNVSRNASFTRRSGENVRLTFGSEHKSNRSCIHHPQQARSHRSTAPRQQVANVCVTEPPLKWPAQVGLTRVHLHLHPHTMTKIAFLCHTPMRPVTLAGLDLASAAMPCAVMVQTSCFRNTQATTTTSPSTHLCKLRLPCSIG
jgi:hypothetical protein